MGNYIQQEAFKECHGLQCGFCTPGFLMTVCALIEQNNDPTEQEITEAIAGNLCRCTGYQTYAAVRRAAEITRSDKKMTPLAFYERSAEQKMTGLLQAVVPLQMTRVNWPLFDHD